MGKTLLCGVAQLIGLDKVERAKLVLITIRWEIQRRGCMYLVRFGSFQPDRHGHSRIISCWRALNLAPIRFCSRKLALNCAGRSDFVGSPGHHTGALVNRLGEDFGNDIPLAIDSQGHGMAAVVYEANKDVCDD